MRLRCWKHNDRAIETYENGTRVFFFSFFYTCRLYNRKQIRRNLFKESSVEVEVSPRELCNGIELYACDGNSTMGKSQSSNRRAKRNLKHNFSFFSSRRREKNVGFVVEHRKTLPTWKTEKSDYALD